MIDVNLPVFLEGCDLEVTPLRPYPYSQNKRLYEFRLPKGVSCLKNGGPSSLSESFWYDLNTGEYDVDQGRGKYRKLYNKVDYPSLENIGLIN